MKTCPYCQEDVHDNAIKCRHCHSMLLPVRLSEQSPDDRRVTYIVDRDLIRFGKFAGAVLAIFLVVGAFAFGFKLDRALEKAKDLQDDAEAVHKKMRSAQANLEEAQTLVAGLKSDVELTLEAARARLGDIDDQHFLALALVSAMRQLTPEQEAARDRAGELALGKIRPNGTGRLWRPGTILRIRFLDGDPAAHRTVKEAAAEWAKYANIRFAFVGSGESEIRISFESSGSWSYIGSDALGVSPNAPTMNLQWQERKNVLHEFGHMLGLIHEHQQPNADIPWAKERILSWAFETQRWSEEHVEANIFTRVSRAQFPFDKPFDPNSIMALPFPAEFTGGLELGRATDLSPGDKAFIAQLYPRPNAPQG